MLSPYSSIRTLSSRTGEPRRQVFTANDVQLAEFALRPVQARKRWTTPWHRWMPSVLSQKTLMTSAYALMHGRTSAARGTPNFFSLSNRRTSGTSAAINSSGPSTHPPPAEPGSLHHLSHSTPRMPNQDICLGTGSGTETQRRGGGVHAT